MELLAVWDSVLTGRALRGVLSEHVLAAAPADGGSGRREPLGAHKGPNTEMAGRRGPAGGGARSGPGADGGGNGSRDAAGSATGSKGPPRARRSAGRRCWLRVISLDGSPRRSQRPSGWSPTQPSRQKTSQEARTPVELRASPAVSTSLACRPGGGRERRRRAARAGCRGRRGGAARRAAAPHRVRARRLRSPLAGTRWSQPRRRSLGGRRATCAYAAAGRGLAASAFTAVAPVTAPSASCLKRSIETTRTSCSTRSTLRARTRHMYFGLRPGFRAAAPSSARSAAARRPRLS
jgi:hypothetical protein